MKARKFIAIMMLSAAVAFAGCETTTDVSPGGEEENNQTDTAAAGDLASLSPEAGEGDGSDSSKANADGSGRAGGEDVAEGSADGSGSSEAIVDAPAASDLESEAINSLQTVYFDFDKSDIQESFKAVLARNYEWIKQNPGLKIQLEGHADERGTNEYNLALGERRANAVLEYLISLGANSESFSTTSFGEERPESAGHDEDAWQKNRRVEFTRL